MIGDKKIVEFEKYCPTCAFSEKGASSDPCNKCLGIPARVDSHKPENWKEKAHADHKRDASSSP